MSSVTDVVTATSSSLDSVQGSMRTYWSLVYGCPKCHQLPNISHSDGGPNGYCPWGRHYGYRGSPTSDRSYLGWAKLCPQRTTHHTCRQFLFLFFAPRLGVEKHRLVLHESGLWSPVGRRLFKSRYFPSISAYRWVGQFQIHWLLGKLSRLRQPCVHTDLCRARQRHRGEIS